MKGRRTTLAALAFASALLAAPPARAEVWEDAGWGVLTVISNIGYMPAKMLYSVTGGITGGFAFLLTGFDSDPAYRIWDMSMGGTYVVTPPMLRGEDEIVFVGRTNEEQVAAEAVPPGPAAQGSTLGEQRLGGS